MHRVAASPLSLPPSLAPSTLLITSSSLSSAPALSIPSPTDAAQQLVLSHADWHKAVLQLKTEGAALKEAEFLLKGVDAPKPAAQKAAGAPAPAGSSAAAKAQADLEGQAGVQLGLTVKKEQAVFGDWYQQVLIKGEMLDYYDISGCYILKPWSYGIWQEIQSKVSRPPARRSADTDGRSPCSVVRPPHQGPRRQQRLLPHVCVADRPRAGKGPHRRFRSRGRMGHSRVRRLCRCIPATGPC